MSIRYNLEVDQFIFLIILFLNYIILKKILERNASKNISIYSNFKIYQKKLNLQKFNFSGLYFGFLLFIWKNESDENF